MIKAIEINNQKLSSRIITDTKAQEEQWKLQREEKDQIAKSKKVHPE